MLKKGLQIVGLVLIIGACSDRADPKVQSLEDEVKELNQQLKELQEPLYSNPTDINGIFELGTEKQAIGICDPATSPAQHPLAAKDRASCKMPVNVDGSYQPCWLEFSGLASAQLHKLAGTNLLEDGMFWIEGKGRLAVQPGHFGHLGSYTCQVILEDVHLLTSTDHWLAPPPGPKKKLRSPKPGSETPRTSRR